MYLCTGDEFYLKFVGVRSAYQQTQASQLYPLSEVNFSTTQGELHTKLRQLPRQFPHFSLHFPSGSLQHHSGRILGQRSHRLRCSTAEWLFCLRVRAASCLSYYPSFCVQGTRGRNVYFPRHLVITSIFYLALLILILNCF